MPWDLISEQLAMVCALATCPKRSPFDSMARKRIPASEDSLHPHVALEFMDWRCLESVHDIEGNGGGGQVVARLHFRGKGQCVPKPATGGDHKKIIPADFAGAGAGQICYNRS